MVPPVQVNGPLTVSVPPTEIVPTVKRKAVAAAEVTVPVGTLSVPPLTANVPAPDRHRQASSDHQMASR